MLVQFGEVTRRMKCGQLWPSRHWVLWLLQSCACNPLKDPLLLEDMVRSLLDLGGCWERNFSSSLLLIISVAEGLSVGSNETSQSTNLYWKKKISNIVKILHWFGFFNFKLKNVLRFLFLCKYFKITWFHCFLSNRKNRNYAKLLSKLPCPKTKSEILKSVRGVSCNCICIFIPCV